MTEGEKDDIINTKAGESGFRITEYVSGQSYSNVTTQSYRDLSSQPVAVFSALGGGYVAG